MADIIGTDQADTLRGTSGSDRIYGLDGKDLLHGGSGSDLLEGGDDSDVLHGGTGRDFLYGGKGSDRLYGGAGADWLVGGRGADLLAGGSGDDTFLFDHATLAGGYDKVTDFAVGDILKFDDFNLQPTDYYMDFTQVGNDVLVSYVDQSSPKGGVLVTEVVLVLNATVEAVYASADFSGSLM